MKKIYLWSETKGEGLSPLMGGSEFSYADLTPGLVFG